MSNHNKAGATERVVHHWIDRETMKIQDTMTSTIMTSSIVKAKKQPPDKTSVTRGKKKTLFLEASLLSSHAYVMDWSYPEALHLKKKNQENKHKQY